MTSENNSLPLNLQEVDKTTGEVVKLDVNSTSTVQPVAPHEARSLRSNPEINLQE